MKQFKALFGKIQGVVNVISAAALIVTILVIVIQTGARYIIHSSIPWSEELSRFLFVIIIMLCFNIAISRDMLVNINILDIVLEGKTSLKVIEIFRLLVGLFVEVFFFLSSLQLIGIGWVQKSPAMQIAMGWMYIFVAAGFLMSIVSVVLKLIEKISALRGGKEESV